MNKMKFAKVDPRVVKFPNFIPLEISEIFKEMFMLESFGNIYFKNKNVL